ncbi:MAG: MIP/aquaporin family protein [Chlamydiales bacterium]
MTIFLAELFGTFLLLLLGNGVVANALLSQSKGEKGGWIVITAGWGFAVAIGVYAVGWVSGGHLNPAVTLSLALIKLTPWPLVPLYIGGQIIGSMLGALFVWLSYYPHWAVTQEADMKLLCFCTKPAIRKLKWNFLNEIIGTAALLIGVLAIFNAHNGIGSGVGPYAVGILIFSIGLSLGGPTGFAINPARDLGPRLMHQWLPIAGKRDSDWSYAWVPILGPLIGGPLGAFLYHWLISPLTPLL